MRRTVLIFALMIILALSSCAVIYDETGSDVLSSPVIMINGERLPLPFKESDLPDGYELSDDVNVYIMNGEYHYCSLLYNGEAVSNVYLDGYEDGMKSNEFTVRSIGFSASDNSEFCETLTINSIGKSSTTTDILKALGSPHSKTSGSNGVDIMTYRFEDGTSVTFWGRHGEPITKMFAVNRLDESIEGVTE